MKQKIQATRLNKEQLEYLENYMYNHKFENMSQAVRAIINDSMITNPMPTLGGNTNAK